MGGEMNKDKIKELWQMPIYEGSENEADGWEFCEVRHPKKMTCEEFGVTEYHRRKLIVTGESISIPDEPVVVELMEKVDKAIKALFQKARWGEPYLLELLAVIALVREHDNSEPAQANAKIARVRDDATKQEQARIIAQIPYFCFSTETEIQVIRTEDLISIIRRNKEVTDDTQNKNFKIDELLTNLKLLTELCEKNRFTTICALDEEAEG
jgi:hypothetical protein